ncbi:MAG: hypothetical protein UV95_C0001G0171 [Candidatus Falkowbacteria bacterium GW2011_GWF2_43_32]|nr:MAG: hypothetical protein UV95_C0001G0171 [Candidatus Falkowbacteria bacterium GW2011_GWF2_43_32]
MVTAKRWLIRRLADSRFLAVTKMVISSASELRKVKQRNVAQGEIIMEKYLFTIQNVETGKLNALVNNIMKQTGIDDPNEAIRMVNAGEVQISVIKPKWTEKDSVIRFSVTSDGTTGEEWISRLESKSFRVGDYAKSVLRSKNFKPTSGITYKIAVLKGDLFSDNERVTKNIRKDAKNRKLTTPNAEVACLIRERFSDKELEAMDLYWIVVMHEPIKDSDGDSTLLYANRDFNSSSLSSFCDNPDGKWNRRHGVAFVVS